MTGWLESWDEEVPDGGMAGMGHGDLSHDEMPGVMQELLAP